LTKPTNSSTLISFSKLWNYCNILRVDGMSYGDDPRFRGDRLEQLTYLLFVKMADERARPPYSQPSLMPAQYTWPALLAGDRDELFDHCRHTLEALESEKGALARIVNKAQNKLDSDRAGPRPSAALRTPKFAPGGSVRTRPS
jgi:type I restriction enzyme M protein